MQIRELCLRNIEFIETDLDARLPQDQCMCRCARIRQPGSGFIGICVHVRPST